MRVRCLGDSSPIVFSFPSVGFLDRSFKLLDKYYPILITLLVVL